VGAKDIALVSRPVARPAAQPIKVTRRARSVDAAPRRRKPTYYWELPYSNGALPLSEGSVVMTVRLSRDQLRLAGVPVTDVAPASQTSWVRAKVLVGADGLPRAIAFDQD